MIRHICSIVRNEWRSSLSLWLELVIVAALFWYVVDDLYITYRIYTQPVGFDVEHTYCLELGLLDEHSPMYDASIDEEKRKEQLIQIFNRLKHSPLLEAVSISRNARPYSSNNSSISLTHDTISRQALVRLVSPNFFRVFRYHDLDGSTDALVQALERGELVLSEDYAEELYGAGKAREALGQELEVGETSSPENQRVRVGAVSDIVRYSEFSNWTTYFAANLSEESIRLFAYPNFISYIEICMRVKPGEDRDFVRRFREELGEQVSLGNYYVANFFSIEQDRGEYLRDNVNEAKTKLFQLGFLLMNIFLGVVGVFWFRTEARRAEIGLRLSLGDTSRGILSMYFLEGLILLALAMLPAMGIFYALGHWEVIRVGFMPLTLGRYAIGLGLTYLLLALMIVIGIWLPARKAIRISPAEALRSE